MITLMKHTAGKVMSFALILFFVALGLVGIVLPILPGLLFLMIAALIAARHFPALAFLLKQNHYGAKCLRLSNGFMDLNIWDRTRLCFWGTVKISVDGVVWSLALLKKSADLLVQRFR